MHDEGTSDDSDDEDASIHEQNSFYGASSASNDEDEEVNPVDDGM